MRTSVAKIIPAFQEHFEGRIPHPYLDIEGLVTVGIGCKIDPVEDALSVPFNTNNHLATQEEIRDSWSETKAMKPGMIAGYYATSQLRLSDEDIDALCIQHLAGEESALRGHFAGWDESPANAQLGALSMAYAMGTGELIEGFPKFCSAFEACDWVTCAAECKMIETGNAGLIPRNLANLRLFEAAASDADPDDIAWP